MAREVVLKNVAHNEGTLRHLKRYFGRNKSMIMQLNEDQYRYVHFYDNNKKVMRKKPDGTFEETTVTMTFGVDEMREMIETFQTMQLLGEHFRTPLPSNLYQTRTGYIVSIEKDNMTPQLSHAPLTPMSAYLNAPGTVETTSTTTIPQVSPYNIFPTVGATSATDNDFPTHRTSDTLSTSAAAVLREISPYTCSSAPSTVTLGTFIPEMSKYTCTPATMATSTIPQFAPFSATSTKTTGTMIPDFCTVTTTSSTIPHFTTYSATAPVTTASTSSAPLSLYNDSVELPSTSHSMVSNILFTRCCF